MTKKPKSTAQKRARAMQAETGLPYQTCLNICREEQEAREAERSEVDPDPQFAPPTQTRGLFSHS